MAVVLKPENPAPLHEDKLNRLLRRVDWRFLLPSPNPDQTVCFSQGLLAEAVELISGRVIEPARVRPATCDLAVAINPPKATLLAAREALKPGGYAYFEWHLAQSGGIAGLRKRLTGLGFDEISCYWAWPRPEKASPLFWLPLEKPQALRYFLQNRPSSGSRRQNLARFILKIVWLILRRGGLLFPVEVIARKAGGPKTELLMPVTTGLLKKSWNKNIAGPVPGRLVWLLLTGGQRSINKIVGLGFADRESEPRLVLKLPRVPESIPALRREAESLRMVHSRHPDALRGVPKVLLCEELPGGSIAVGETVLKGEPLFTRLNRQNFRSLALKATDWQIELARASMSDGVKTNRTRLNRLVKPVLKEFSADFAPLLDHERLELTRLKLATLPYLPMVIEQRDFSPWNVLLDKAGELVVLDWESAELEGLPGLDLIYFLTYLTFFLDGAMENGQFRHSYRNMLNPASFTGQVFCEGLERYATKLELNFQELTRLRLFTWVMHACSEYRNLLSEKGENPGPEKLQTSVFFNLWQEELDYLNSAALE